MLNVLNQDNLPRATRSTAKYFHIRHLSSVALKLSDSIVYLLKNMLRYTDAIQL